jgi:hypothetical protein
MVIMITIRPAGPRWGGAASMMIMITIGQRAATGAASMMIMITIGQRAAMGAASMMIMITIGQGPRRARRR